MKFRLSFCLTFNEAARPMATPTAQIQYALYHLCKSGTHRATKHFDKTPQVLGGQGEGKHFRAFTAKQQSRGRRTSTPAALGGLPPNCSADLRISKIALRLPTAASARLMRLP